VTEAELRVLALGNAYPPHHLGGYEVIWHGVSEQLRADGHATRILTTNYRRAGIADDDPSVVRELDWYWRDHRWRRIGLRGTVALERHNAAVLARELADFAPDVVCWWPVGGMSLSLIEQVRRRGLPAVFFVLDYWPGYGFAHDLWLARWRRLAPLRPLAELVTGIPARCKLADAGDWVFCSRTAVQETAAMGLHVDQPAVLAPGVARSFVTPLQPPRNEPWRGRLLYLGRVVEQKGVATAVEALPHLRDTTLRIVGDGDREYREALEQLARSLGVTERVRFEPAAPRARVPELLREADALVFPVCWAEPWGLVPLEAMSQRLPVIATGRGGSGEYLVHGRNCLLFEAGDACGLAAAVERLASDPGLRRRLVDGGLETASRLGEDQFNRAAAERITAAGAGAGRR
jgi:glycosyltransferase involved in cell wall biosynthesis